jgi:2,7-dihydroxy-5-methyl-1-naphthoate 7-O-methyltransferase
VTIGVAERTPDGYRTTAYGANLCADADNGLTDLLHLDAAGGRAELAFVELAHSVITGQAAYPRRYVRISGPTSPSTPICGNRSTGR